jgi:hypothetical protein
MTCFLISRVGRLIFGIFILNLPALVQKLITEKCSKMDAFFSVRGLIAFACEFFFFAAEFKVQC